MVTNNNKVIIFDTTMRDGELAPGVQMNLADKISIAQLLEKMGVDAIEVGYPGRYKKDFQEIFKISQIIKQAIICGLASADREEIMTVGQAIKQAEKGRIHTYISVNLKENKVGEERVLTAIKDSVSLARNYCDDVEWSAFDAPRSDREFLCRALELAILSGATTINIPDSLGLLTPEEFSQLIAMIFNRVPNINDAMVSVHCHDDRGYAVDNAIAALDLGVRQIECAINGLGARKGNAKLETVVEKILEQQKYKIEIDSSLMSAASDLVARISGREN
ncbi:MAG: 2-isopropylmalate synthase [Hormoscilla sp. GM7CHS1pb]|nr:2-isopropylmalate synthase [Hormoscilla sp. GM7CHS1pb]